MLDGGVFYRPLWESQRVVCRLIASPARSEERCGEVGPVGGRVGGRQGEGKGGREGKERRRSHIISHTQSVKEHTVSVSLIFHDYF